MARSPFPVSLGEEVAGWIERWCCHGPGDVYGEPVRLTDEEVRFLVEAYRVDPRTGRRSTDVAAYVRRKGTRKSELGAWLVIVETTGPARAFLDAGEVHLGPPTDPLAQCIATTEDQGDLVYGAFRAIVKASPELEPLYDTGQEVSYLTETAGRVELLQARNAAALDGARPTFEVADELHLWTARLRESFATVRRNLRKRHASQPWLFAPTTPYAIGQDSILESLHEAVGRKDTGQHRAGRTLVDWRAASDGWNLGDPVQLREAITEAGGDAYWGDVEGIAAELEDGSTAEHEFRRYWLGQALKVQADSWLPAGTMDRTFVDGLELVEVDVDDDRLGRPVVVGLDMALRHDTAAVVAVQLNPDTDRYEATGRVFRPDGDALDVAAVEAEVRRLHQTLPVVSVAYDPAYFQRSAQALLDEGVPMVEVSQTAARMVPACGLAFSIITGGQFAHAFPPEVAAQVTAAAPKAAGEGWRLSKGRARAKVDAAIALVQALAELDDHLNELAAGSDPVDAWVIFQ